MPVSIIDGEEEGSDTDSDDETSESNSEEDPDAEDASEDESGEAHPMPPSDDKVPPDREKSNASS